MTNEIKHLYETEYYSVHKISKRFKISVNQVIKILRKLKVELRKKGGNMRGKFELQKRIDSVKPEELSFYYLEKRYSINRIARIYKINNYNISNLLIKYNIPKRKQGNPHYALRDSGNTERHRLNYFEQMLY